MRSLLKPRAPPRRVHRADRALLFGYFLTVTQTPQQLTEFLTGLGIGRYGVLAVIMLSIWCSMLMDSLAMIILTVPIIFP